MANEVLCTDLCMRLRDLDVENRKLLTHSELTSYLDLPTDSGDTSPQGLCLGTIEDLRQRKNCAFCQLVLAAVSEDEAGSNGVHADPKREIYVFVFPDEQSLRLTLSTSLGTQLAFVAPSINSISGPDNARLVDSSKIDLSFIRGWLEQCERHHRTACSTHLTDAVRTTPVIEGLNFDEFATSNFRVLDLFLGCVKKVPSSSRYVALSYVWGQLPMLKLERKNLSQLATEGSLNSIRGALPRTVNDAIDLVSALNEKYLWIDALCLVQDDPNDMSMGIEMMNSIYQGSYFTIVAGSGIDADFGLLGIHAGSRRSSQVVRELRPGLKMTILHSIDWHLRRSTYNSRGWTLQELVLPRRALIFINSQVYFRCQEANWSEESWADSWERWLDDDDSNICRLPGRNEGPLQSFWAYQKILEDYSLRHLRFDGDALRAVAGILRPLAAGMQTVMLEGLPVAFLDMGLLLISEHGNLRRRKQFPSFSWAGWSGRIMWPRENYHWFEDQGQRWDTENLLKWLDHKTFVSWNVFQPSGTLDQLCLEPLNKPSRLEALVHTLPHIFSGAATDGLKKRDDPLGSFVRSRSPKSRRPSNSDRRSPQHMSLNDLDLVNSEEGFDKLARAREQVRMFNWVASRKARIRKSQKRKASQVKDGEGPASIANENAARHYCFRDFKIDTHSEDRRTQNARATMAEKLKVLEDDVSVSKSIPVYPPYPVLHFRTICIYLFLGQTPHPVVNVGARAGIDGRIPGIPLLSSSKRVVGSLHPDNIDLLPSVPGSQIACLLLSHSQLPTMSSALFNQGAVPKGSPDRAISAEEPWNLFWIMHVVWDLERNGIAERLGIGQVLATDALEVGNRLPAPEIKTVMLG